ncbi:AP-4 complex subunit sigma-1-like [Liolophura sinensis]|uniref:AP-4 complex subunit sigma-1-like n=1 Tax=Liolophura sinensis TaxID=3198878 RepID=UPI0031581329
MLKFLLVVNRQGHKRVSRYYEHMGHPDDRLTTELDIVRRTLSHDHKQCSFLDYHDYRLIYRKYLNLYFIIGVDKDEAQIMYNIDHVHMILDEMIVNGQVVETSQSRILGPIQLLDAAKK